MKWLTKEQKLLRKLARMAESYAWFSASGNRGVKPGQTLDEYMNRHPEDMETIWNIKSEDAQNVKPIPHYKGR